MNLIVGIIIVSLFYFLCADQIKKKAVLFYVGTYVWICFVVIYSNFGWYRLVPRWFNSYFMDIFRRGLFSMVTFMVVMFVGCVVHQTKLSKKLLKARGEISIMGCIFALCHNVSYGIVYFPALFLNPERLGPQRMIAAIISIILILLMIPLGITSFKCVRKKMKAASWKKLQRLAYPFFYLIYIHVMVLYSLMWRTKILEISVYTIIFVTYTVLRLRKYRIDKKKRAMKAAKNQIKS